MRKNKRRKPMAEINVVPYIDVTLVLLIIFMITTPMLQTGVEVDLPKAKSETVDSSGEGVSPIIISIKKEGQYYITIDSDESEIQQEDINGKVKDAMSTNKNPQVLINADKGVDYGTVVELMASLKNAGVDKVGLMTQSDDGK
ncbi:MAG: protein TolR [Methyloglobulus sp.]|nr:protein TolR [Methyloglobulus sp.]